MRNIIELAVKAGRKRQSPQTGYIHHCYENPWGTRQDTIPFFENACFALALFRTRLAENVLEAKALLEKLFQFQVERNFPVYLHEYPLCRNPRQADRFAFVLSTIFKEFQQVLGSELKERVLKTLSMLAGEDASPTRIAQECKTPEAYAEALIYGMIDYTQILHLWHSRLHAYIGPGQTQEGGQPTLTLFDLYMCQLFGSFSKRAVEDHPIQMRAALLYPPEVEACTLPQQASGTTCIMAENTFLWGSREQLYSLVAAPKKSVLTFDQEMMTYTFVLPETIPDECGLKGGGDALEAAFYCNVHPDTTLFVNGSRATTFQIGDSLEIVSKGIRLHMKFSVKNGEGKFFGQIARANRPTQCAVRGDDPYTAYDWQIAMRTLSRTPACTLACKISFVTI